MSSLSEILALEVIRLNAEVRHLQEENARLRAAHQTMHADVLTGLEQTSLSAFRAGEEHGKMLRSMEGRRA